MLEKIKGWIDSNALLTEGDKVIAACSGGPDSLALVHILQGLAADYRFTLVVAHVDHMLRGQESAADAAFVAAFCADNGLPCYMKAINVAEFAQMSGRSLEDAAREKRYEFFRQVADELGGAKIATGHHADDQAETVLINLLRGAGSSGLRGMQAQNGDVIRPLLAVSRKEIEDYCKRNNLKARIDATNFETEYLRNKVRLNLLPLLESDYNPSIKEALNRTAIIMGDYYDYIRQAAESLWPDIVMKKQDMYVVNCLKLLQQHVALQRELLRLTVERKQGNLKGIAFYHVEKLINMAKTAAVGKVAELPGQLLVKKDYRHLVVGWRPNYVKSAMLPIKLVIPGITYIAQSNVKITAEIVDSVPFDSCKQVGVFDWENIKMPIYVRTRLPGDRFEPLGLKGSKKLKDFFIDAKIPQEERDNILLVCDSDGIIWVAGYRQSERGKVTSQTRHFLRLKIQQG